MDIKEPAFDKPVGIGTTGERRVVNPDTAPVEVGTRVMLVYQGNHMLAEVTEVEEPNSRFVGSVLEFEGGALEFRDLRHGDLVRFRRRDLRWIDLAFASHPLFAYAASAGRSCPSPFRTVSMRREQFRSLPVSPS